VHDGLPAALEIDHTSAREIGQIYIPSVNWALMLATIAMVLSFGSSSSLAAAYGIAVTSTMAITTILAYQVTHRRWKWPLGAVHRRDGRVSWWPTSRSSAPTCSRSPTAAGCRWRWARWCWC
jgi:hypothetical protein